MKIIWYEDLTTNFEEEVRGLSEFTGYKLSEENMTVKTRMSKVIINSIRHDKQVYV